MPLRFDEPLPATFDPAFYRAAHPDLALADDAAAARHFAAEGREAGRIASPLARREGLIAAIDTTRPVLEIGPFCSPLVKGPGVEYLDRLDAAALRARAAAIGRDPVDCPPVIHHVGTLDAVEDGRFDAIVAAHSLEHHPDLVRHLEEAARVLRDGGRYYLILPDKRFCFDHFLPESTLADVLDAFEAERTGHRLASVVEHVALTTHNDPARHWRGDHGAPTAEDRQRRTAEALAAYRGAAGDYLDVHAWQFTPASFTALLEALARLDLSAFEVEAVYDTPHNQGEFCAVLRRSRPARRHARRRHAAEIMVMQTADPFRYARMLAVTAPNVTEYCRRHGFAYESFVGVKRGAWPWQATFNRIVMLEELAARGFAGWALYLDADAYVHDLDFDLVAYLAERGDHAAIFAESGMGGGRWDVNAGVALVNLGQPGGRRLVTAWAARLAQLSDARLKAMKEWGEDNDQDMLHAVLREAPDLLDLVLVESTDVLNSAHAQFIRRSGAQFDTLDARLAAIGEEVAAVARTWRLPDAAPVAAGSREAARLPRAPVEGAWLTEARPGEGGMLAAERAISAWRAAAAPPDDAWTCALQGEDVAGVARMLQRLGREPVARGLLGGDRQHERHAADPAFARERALRTHDALLSLAELTGAVPVENPNLGPWGRTRRIAPPALFAAIEATLDRELAPPRTIGAYLGLEVGRGLVLHLRMAEAIHLAWRAGQVAAMLGLRQVAELGGGIGLAAWYARALGLLSYRLVAPAAMQALQAGVLADQVPATAITGRIEGSLDMLVAEDLATQAEAEVAEHLADAAAHGARAILSMGHEASADPARPWTAAALIARAGGWRRVGRARHGLRPGYVEELFVREP